MPSQFIIKHFYKSRAVICVIHYPDKRVRTFWAIPDGNKVDIGGCTYSCDSTKDFFSLNKGIPQFTYLWDKIEPIRVDNQPASIYSPEELNTAINNNVVDQIFSSTERKGDVSKILMIGLFCIVAVLGLACYLLYNKITEQRIILDELRQILKTVTGQ